MFICPFCGDSNLWLGIIYPVGLLYDCLQQVGLTVLQILTRQRQIDRVETYDICCPFMSKMIFYNCECSVKPFLNLWLDFNVIKIALHMLILHPRQRIRSKHCNHYIVDVDKRVSMFQSH